MVSILITMLTVEGSKWQSDTINVLGAVDVLTSRSGMDSGVVKIVSNGV